MRSIGSTCKMLPDAHSSTESGAQKAMPRQPESNMEPNEMPCPEELGEDDYVRTYPMRIEFEPEWYEQEELE